MTESEKLQAQQAWQEKQNETNFEQQQELARLNSTLSIERAIEESKLKQSDPLYQAQLAKAKKDAVVPPYTPFGLATEASQKLDQLGLSPHQQELVASIMRGEQPPITSIQRTPEITKILGGLAALGYDNTKAVQDWTSMQKRLSSMNSTQQLRLAQAVDALDGSIGQAERLYADWQATGLPSGFVDWNKKALEVSSRLPGEAGVAAKTLLSHIEDMAAELATVYRGGNSATDMALAAAQKSLSADWTPAQFARNLELIRENLNIRRNSMANSSQITGNIYSPAPVETGIQGNVFKSTSGNTYNLPF
jgi:hypothetical protein